MTFSPALEERFAKLLTIYPKGRQRSAVVPMLLYAQDEVGHVSHELIEEVARRCGITPMQVDEVIGYYSMLHRRPLGKFHIQVCTNVCCMLVGGQQTVAANMAVAAYLLGRVHKTIFEGKEDLEGEVMFDLGNGFAQPHDMRSDEELAKASKEREEASV